jgi:transposase
VFSASGG